jgi:hypothetical protein
VTSACDGDGSLARRAGVILRSTTSPETNNDEERMARVEKMVETVQRESDARKRRATTVNVIAGTLLLMNVAAKLLPARTSRKD